MRRWLRNVYLAVITVAQALWVCLRYWFRTYDPKRKTFTEQYEYPELPTHVAPRFRGFHRYNITACIACERCARDCPVNCITIGKHRATGRKGFQVTGFTIDYGKCMFCGICTESCPGDCIFMGSSYDLSCYNHEGCVVDFSRLPIEVAWGQATLNPTVVANAKSIVHPVYNGPVSS
jgi:NADH-quinone oxidoreductase subunit I